MLAPFILVLLVASWLLLLAGWASEELRASMHYGQGYPYSASDKGWQPTIPRRTPRQYDDSSATWTSRFVPAVTTPRDSPCARIRPSGQFRADLNKVGVVSHPRELTAMDLAIIKPGPRRG